MPNCADVFKSFGKSSKHEPEQLLTREWFIVLIVQCCVDRLLFMIGIMVEIWRTEQPIRWPVTLTLWSAYLVSMVTVTWPNHEASSTGGSLMSTVLCFTFTTFVFSRAGAQSEQGRLPRLPVLPGGGQLPSQGVRAVNAALDFITPPAPPAPRPVLWFSRVLWAYMFR